MKNEHNHSHQMPHCQSPNITRNGKEIKGKHRTESPHYRCKDCGRQFISNHEITYRGCLPWIVNMLEIMLVRGMGIRDISAVLHISIAKVLKVLKSVHYKIKPKVSHYDCLEIDKFWTSVVKKKNKVYHRESGEIVASNRRFAVWGKRDIKTAKRLRRRIKRLGISYDRIATDGWESFPASFKEDRHVVGNEHPEGRAGNIGTYGSAAG